MPHLVIEAGSVLCLLIGLGFIGVAVHDLRLLRLALWGQQVDGYVESVTVIQRDQTGDPTQWSVTTAFNVVEADRHKTYRCTDIQYEPYSAGKKVPVHYRRNRPDRWATIRDPKSTLARASGFGVLALVCLWLSTAWVLKGL
jgi:hypothetical protein